MATKSAPKVLGVITEINGCAIYRIIMPFAHLHQRGYTCNWADETILDRTPFWDYDVIVLARITPGTPADMPNYRAFVQHCKEMGKKVVYEIDDDLLHIPDHNPVTPAYTPFIIDAMTEVIASSDLVTVTNEHLREQLLPLNPNIVVLPNAMDPDFWMTTKDNRRIRQVPGLTVGVHGGHSHEKDWLILADVLPEIARRYPEVNIVFAGYHPQWLDSLHIPDDRLFRIAWVPVEQYPQSVAQIDIGLCPLEDTLFNRSKSPIKFYEHSLAGAPTVCSPTIYSDAVEDGRTGFLAQGPDDWLRSISKLIESPYLRRTISAAARGGVLRSRNIHELAPRWMQVYRKLWQSD